MGVLWSILTLPFRMIAAVVAFFGRTLGVIAGFALMVAGVGLCASTIYLLGLPVFVVGLLVTLKSLG